MVKKNAGGNYLKKADSCPPAINGGSHVSRWGVAKLHMKEKLVNAAGKISRGSSTESKELPKIYTDGKPLVLVGPVIGLVTESTARILLEVDRAASVEVSLRKLQESHRNYLQDDSPSSESFVSSFSQRLWRGKSSPTWLRASISAEFSSFANMETAENSAHSRDNNAIKSCDDTESSTSSTRTQTKSRGLSMPRSLRKSRWRKSSTDSMHGVSSSEKELLTDKEMPCTSSYEPSMTEKDIENRSVFPRRRRSSRSFVKLWKGSSLSPRRSLLSKSGLDYLAQGDVGQEVRVVKDMVAMRPCVFEFTALEAESQYMVEVKGCHDAVRSSFKTFSMEPAKRFCMASISCNSIFITNKTITSLDDLWSHLFRYMRLKEVNLLIHLGDQIYGDGDRNLDAGAGKDLDKWSNRFKIALHMLRDLPEGQWESKQGEICEKYREVYRETWKYPPTAKCLAHCSNLMIYDDHEIRDNWGDNRRDRRKDCKEFFVAKCAWRVSLEYQRQLHEDVNFSNLEAIDKDHHFHVIGNIGLMFLDIRGSRTFHRVENDGTPYLGSRQWVDIGAALADGGLFDRARVLVVCSPAPLVFLVGAVTRAAPSIADRLEDFKGHWSAYKDEQKKMIDCLRNWKESRPGREVIVLGGDVHCGGHSCILKSNETLFYQLTTSPIANMPLPKTVYYAMRFAEQLEHIEKGFKFRHFNWTRARNYGLVHVRIRGKEDDGELPEVITQLVKGKFLRPTRMGKEVSNLEEYTCTTCSSMRPVEWCKTRMFNAAFWTCQKTILSGSDRRPETIEKDDEDSHKHVD